MLERGLPSLIKWRRNLFFVAVRETANGGDEERGWSGEPLREGDRLGRGIRNGKSRAVLSTRRHETEEDDSLTGVKSCRRDEEAGEGGGGNQFPPSG